MREIALEIQGLGIILYSPHAIAHITEGSDYLGSDFTEPADVARHVMACGLTGFCTGSPGNYSLRFIDSPPEEKAFQASHYKLRLGLQVKDGIICVRDLYDLIAWDGSCPENQQLAVPDGCYRLTVLTSIPPSGIVGDNQTIIIYLENMNEKPALRWEGVPMLCE
ncbi:MAG: hypothetical protein K0Q55_287 [Verrucomicrobia bacterium]|jgi:hypothetical protein|nr:hypothetical protein [Verrucomicrobiota bacterium]